MKFSKFEKSIIIISFSLDGYFGVVTNRERLLRSYKFSPKIQGLFLLWLFFSIQSLKSNFFQGEVGWVRTLSFKGMFFFIITL